MSITVLGALTMSSVYYQHSKLLSSDISLERARSFLHYHPNLIELSPVLSHYEEVAHPHASAAYPNTKRYVVTDTVSYLPFGLWEGHQKVHVDCINQDNGILVVKQAPFGMTFKELWSLRMTGSLDTDNMKSTNPDEQWLELHVDVEMKGGKFVVSAFKNYMQQNHLIYLDALVSLLHKD
jgi:23S rRNA U2552 (ribose-2'-O)-methylase RlmE/FtsJ